MAQTMEAAARARALRAQGRDIISLTLGEPDFPTPVHAIEAAHRAALDGETKYPPVGGTPALKQAIQAKFRRDSSLDYPIGQILVGHGARQIIYDALTAMLEEGDEIVIPAPYWNAYPLIARMAGAVPVFVPGHAESGFLPEPDAVGRAISARTRCVILNFPNNPTGAVSTPDHLRALAHVLRRHPHVWIMSDDMYEHLIHDGSANPTMAAIAPDLTGRILTISGVSKTYAMTGWRVGFAAGPAVLIDAMAKIQGQSTGGVSPITQAAATAALDGPMDQVHRMRAIYASRSARMVNAVRAMPGIMCHQPRGAFYLYPSIAGLIGGTTGAGRRIDCDTDFCDALLEEAGLAVVPGAAFGLSPSMRLSTAASDEDLTAAATRLKVFISEISR